MASPSEDFRLSQGQVEREGLARTLEKHHITGIAISATIGAGLFIVSGQIISLAGSLGAILSYAAAGMMVVCVMLCLSELVSVRPVPGALFEIPSLYVHDALGFATGWAYWFAYTCSCCTLTVEAAMLLEYWKPELSKSVAILTCWLPIVIFNFFGPVLWYGRLEWGIKWLKIVMILGLLTLMICIAAGVRGSGVQTIQPPSFQWSNHHQFPPGFTFTGSWTSFPQKGDITGHLGAFMGVWTGITTAVFAFLGVETVILTAGEAKYPRHDLPRATRWIYLFAIAVYILLVTSASLNVPFDDPALLPYITPGYADVPVATLRVFPDAANTHLTTGDRSPFLIAFKRAGLDPSFSSFVNGALVFAAATASNTAFYVSSRTLYTLCSSGNVHPQIRQTLGSTSYAGMPLWAIVTTISLSSFAFVGAVEELQNEIIGVVSRISVTCILCVYVAECVAFVRYQKFFERYHGTDRKYKRVQGQETCYRSTGHQPLPAVIAIIFGSLLIIFNGWDVVFRAATNQISASEIAAGIIRSYLGPMLFVALFLSYRSRHGARLKTYSQVESKFRTLPEKELLQEPLEHKAKWKRVLLELK